MPQRCLTWVASATFAILLCSAAAQAGWPWPARVRPYHPQVPSYMVIEPAPAVAAVRGKHGPTHQVEFPWRAHELPTPAYPYGWFGARVEPQHATHYSYYGTYRDRAKWW